MTLSKRHTVLFVFILAMAASLACTLGGADTTSSATSTPVALVTQPATAPATGPTNAPVPSNPPPAPGTQPPPANANTPPAPPSATPTASATPIVGNGPNGCVLNGTFIADITIPDGTVFAPNASFTKTWRVRNDGTCQWDAGYQLVFAEGNQMGGPGGVSVPAAAPGQVVDIAVNLVAPGVPGDYSARWRLRASNSAIFGGYTVVIKVVGTPTPTPTPTATPTLVGGGIWGDVWDSNCGAPDCGQMNLLQTGNTVVGTYAGGSGTLNGAVSGNRLTGTWSRAGDTGSVDFWIDLDTGGVRWHGNFNKTQPWCGQRAGQTPLSPCGVATWYGTWTTNCESGVPCLDLSLTQSGDSVGGSFSGGAGTLNGTVNGTELTGTWTRNPGSPSSTTGAFKFFMTSDGLRFRGNSNTTFYWCGNRSGSSLPSPCLKN